MGAGVILNGLLRKTKGVRAWMACVVHAALGKLMMNCPDLGAFCRLVYGGMLGTLDMIFNTCLRLFQYRLSHTTI